MAGLSEEYCRYNGGADEPFCDYVDSCVKLELEPEVCRPAECPFEHDRGCVLVGTCLGSSSSSSSSGGSGIGNTDFGLDALPY